MEVPKIEMDDPVGDPGDEYSDENWTMDSEDDSDIAIELRDNGKDTEVTELVRRIRSGEFSTISFTHQGSLVDLGDLGVNTSGVEDGDQSRPKSPKPKDPDKSKGGKDGKNATPNSNMKNVPPHEDAEVISVNGKQIISQGSLEGLVGAFFEVNSKAYNPFDQNYMHDFLSTFRFFVSPEYLLEYLIRLIKELDGEKQEEGIPKQLRLINLMRKWFERFTHDFYLSSTLQMKLQDFLTSRVNGAGNNSSIPQYKAFLDIVKERLKKEKGRRENEEKEAKDKFEDELNKRAQKANDSQTLSELENGDMLFNEAYLSTRISPTKFNPIIVAQQLTLLEFDMFVRIEELEYTDYFQATLSDAQTPHLLSPNSPSNPTTLFVPTLNENLTSDSFVIFPPSLVKSLNNLSQMITWTERIIDWVTEQICRTKEQKERSDVIIFFINVGKHCLEIFNFNAVFEIVSGLQSQPVQRLAKTWKSVLGISKYKTMWTDLVNFVSPASNYKSYCKEVEDGLSQSKAVLPWLKIFLSDLHLISKSTTFLPDNRINFYKFYLMGRILRTLTHCKKLILEQRLQLQQTSFAGVSNHSNSEKNRTNVSGGCSEDHANWGLSQLQIQTVPSQFGVNSPELMVEEKTKQWLLKEVTVDESLLSLSSVDLESLSIQCEPPLPNEMQKNNRVFGVDLAVVTARCGVSTKWTHGKIPKFLRDIFEFLEKEEYLTTIGIFRQSGNQMKINEYKQILNESGGELNLTNAHCHDLTGLLKHFLRELPEPLISTKLYHSYRAAAKIEDNEERSELLNSLTLLLPDANQSLLAYLLKYLFLLSTYHEKNKMDMNNISICLAPTVFGEKRVHKRRVSNPIFKTTAEAQINESMKKQSQLCQVFKSMIQNQSTSNFQEKSTLDVKKHKKRFSFSTSRDGK